MGLTREGHTGTGPGSITPDGCAVELYARLSAGTEPEVIGSVLPPGASVLELGCGAGRVTHPLVELGFVVTAVDESAQMLERVHGARTVRSPIEDLDLGEERFDAVVLGSFLVHTSDHRDREGLLGACRRHVKDDGVVLIQREGADYHSDLPREREDRQAGCTIRILSAEPLGDGVDEVRAEYVFEDARWTQTFRSRALSVERFEAYLGEAGLVVDRCLTPDGVWVLARPGKP
ncbi:bifunctional 2-polyprenyl-6-hydroxyphenol methylase/3-demethylubiquinol 3-O-methyltransferase UbiG [Streptomyces sp. NBC_00059]|uniref:class I SAM-dependent methyltransferase n=1 Tax=Streptomyces sp. NBC_00059 TaxID=2975635 RepID=UPI002250D7B6|nr:class I SAM-dependent methyltransferase [Streptomyces sp. NBC_00059]MCX5413274.1 class I SAM-dependent methyltransferase [Streptomyces sp. NBC_00059]